MKKILLLAMMPAIMLGGIKNNYSTTITHAEEISAPGAVAPKEELKPTEACAFIGYEFDEKTNTYISEMDINIDNPATLANIFALVKAYDPQTGNNVEVTMTSNVDNYPENLHVGKYVLEFSATANDYVAHAKLTVNVVDITKPTIVGPSEVTSGYSNPKTISQILSLYYVRDNVDKDIQLSVTNDNYTANKNKIGSYKMTITATDSSKNSFSTNITVHVVDDAAPVLTAPEKIYKNTNTILTISDIEKYVSAFDDIDGDIGVTTKEDKFTGNGNKEGTYQVTFNAKDKAGNSANKTVEVIVDADVKGKGYLVDDKTLVTFNDALLSDTEILSFLTAAELVDGSQAQYLTVTADTYSDSYEKVGVYSYELNIRSTAGVEKVIAIDIKVVEGETGTLVEAKSFFQKIGDFFKRFWNWITGKGWTL